MTNKEIIESIVKWQSNDMLHPLTCGNNSNHKPLLPIEVENKVILSCLDCNYTQKHIPNIVLTY